MLWAVRGSARCACWRAAGAAASPGLAASAGAAPSGAVFSVFAGIYYWISKMCGRQYPEALGKLQFWTLFVGVNLTFFPMHFLGLAGMPRRYADYPDAFAGWNMVASLGSYISAFSAVLFVFVLYRTFTAGERVAENPWGEGATTMEWKLPSPPPFHTYEELPVIK